MSEKKLLTILAFNAGELTPELDVRIDADKYMQGCRTMENILPMVQGGARRMPGTKYVAETKNVHPMT